MRAIDLNADLGETVDAPHGTGAGAPTVTPATVATADDAAMFALVSSASVACGGHAGDAASMRAAVALAARHGVAVGAHPSFPDRPGFGRRAIPIDPSVLGAAVRAQLNALRDAGADIRYVKPHGALYHAAGADAGTAAVVAGEVAALSDALGRAVPILADGVVLADAARAAGLPFVREAFLDRGYLSDGRLVPRGEPGALLHDADVVADRAVRFVREGVVDARDGTPVRLEAASLCVHGDTPESVAMARAVRAALADAGVEVRAPW